MIDFFREEEYRKGMKPEDKIVIASILIGAFLVIAGMGLYITLSQRIGGSVLILGLVTAAVPYGIISFLKSRAIKEVEDQFPSFLNDLAESKRGGMTIIQAFDSAKDTDYGRLNRQIDRIHSELTWGIPFPEVMERFSKRMHESQVIQESISILLQSFRSGGNITDTIESIAEDSKNLKNVLQKKNQKIKQQILIMYIIFFLFVAITIGIYLMLSQLLGLGQPNAGALQDTEFLGGSGGASNFCNGEIIYAEPLCGTAKVFGFVPKNLTSFTSTRATKFKYGQMAYYKSLLFLMLMVQGLCTGAVAGQIGEGSPGAGIKHAIIMIPAAFIIFMYFVGLSGV